MGDEELQDTDELEEEDGDEDGKPEKKRKRFGLSPLIVRILIITLAVIGIIGVCVATSVIVFRVVSGKSKTIDANADITLIAPPAPETFDLGSFNLNTADTDTPRFVRATIILAYTRGDTKIGVELGEKRVILRDEVSRIILSKRASWLQNADNWPMLKNEIKRKVDSKLNTGEIQDVLFEEFIVN